MPNRREVLQQLFAGAALLRYGDLSVAETVNNPPTLGRPFPRSPLMSIPDIQSYSIPGESIEHGAHIPEGFGLRVVARSGVDPMGPRNNAYLWHGEPDGGAVFDADDGGWVYVSNAELRGNRGGAGALRFAANGQLRNAYPILSNTTRNCAGGATPWGTWLSCEENGSEGRVFECNPFGNPQQAQEKPALGKRNHEAAAVDMRERVVYLTEDVPKGRLWRFVADDKDWDEQRQALRMEYGQLQVAQIQGYSPDDFPSVDAETAFLQRPRPVRWLPADPSQHKWWQRLLGQSEGSVFNGGEGIWYHELPERWRAPLSGEGRNSLGIVFFATKGDNRIWAYDVANSSIEIVFDNSMMMGDLPMDQVDNIVVSPAGDLIVAEDGPGMRLLVVTPNGKTKPLVQLAQQGSEITGPAFTSDGARLYFSSQRGPGGERGERPIGVTYELSIPPRYRSTMKSGAKA